MGLVREVKTLGAVASSKARPSTEKVYAARSQEMMMLDSSSM